MKMKELEELAKACITDANRERIERPVVSLTGSTSSGCFQLEITQMYEFVNVTFEDLERLSKLFGTKNINIGDIYSSGGCDTCDYGSRYELTIHIKDPTVVVEND